MHTHMHTHTHTQSHISGHTHTHRVIFQGTHAHTCTHMHTHAHTHTVIYQGNGTEEKLDSKQEATQKSFAWHPGLWLYSIKRTSSPTSQNSKAASSKRPQRNNEETIMITNKWTMAYRHELGCHFFNWKLLRHAHLAMDLSKSSRNCLREVWYMLFTRLISTIKK